MLNKVLVGDLFCLIQFTSCYTMHNAKGCYDQINHNFAILVLMFFGLPWKIARNLFRILQQGRHRIKTVYGVSGPTYGNEDEKEPIAGIGEDNGMGPSLWCLISTVVKKKHANRKARE